MTWRNVSSLGPAALVQARTAFEAALRESGARAGDGGAAEAVVTLSENAAARLLVEEFRRGDERHVWMASWKRASGTPVNPPVVVEKRLLWEQDDAILDIAVLPEGLLVLTPDALVRTTPRQSARLTSSKPWPRDFRGRLRVSGGAVQVFLPGAACSGTVEPLAMGCRTSDEPWTIESGSRSLLLANYATNRNYFDGRVVTQSGTRKSVAPFYTASAADSFWVLTGLDGRAAIFDSALEPAGTAGTWGSDAAATDVRCGGAPVVLGTRAGDGPDSVQAYTIANGAAVALGAPVELPGPVTAFWAPGVAVVRNGAMYQAYAIGVSCAQ